MTLVLALILTAASIACWAKGENVQQGNSTLNPPSPQLYRKLAHASLGMSEDEALLKALQDHKAGKPKDEIEKELESNKKNYGLIDRTGKFVWKQIN